MLKNWLYSYLNFFRNGGKDTPFKFLDGVLAILVVWLMCALFGLLVKVCVDLITILPWPFTLLGLLVFVLMPVVGYLSYIFMAQEDARRKRGADAKENK